MRRELLVTSLAALPLLAGQPLLYQDGSVRLAGYLARPAAVAGKVPGVLVLHQWMGVTGHEQMIADRLAGLGYVAVAADIYGEGVRPKDIKEAAALATHYKSDRALYRRRILAGLEALKAQSGVDPDRVAVVGFCFGGTGALEAARAGMPVVGVVSFHGNLDAVPDPAARPITAKVLVCHGADDPNVPPKDVAGFQDEMRRGKADYTFIAYGGAVHAFTQKEAGNDPSRGVAYQEAAARRSWQHMKDFFAELF
ncbi:MAG: dienelactone hydrolase family protein [Holophaga sp.]|nr:dienelactone hydrolase family protein [Holophaga sp.]